MHLPDIRMNPTLVMRYAVRAACDRGATTLPGLGTPFKRHQQDAQVWYHGYCRSLSSSWVVSSLVDECQAVLLMVKELTNHSPCMASTSTHSAAVGRGQRTVFARTRRRDLP